MSIPGLVAWGSATARKERELDHDYAMTLVEEDGVWATRAAHAARRAREIETPALSNPSSGE
jgi:hypothetical protein